MITNGDIIKTELKDVFEEQNLFPSIVEFYKGVMCNRYKYVIIVPRKCLTEYKCLTLLEEDNFYDDGTVYMTTKGFVRYTEQIRKELEACTDDYIENYIAIVDDIMIYGRGISDFITHFLSHFDQESGIREKLRRSLYLEVLIESSNKYVFKRRYEDILDERFGSFHLYYQMPAIKRASDLFIESFYAACVPNTSFVRTWIYKEMNGHYTFNVSECRLDFSEELRNNVALDFISMPSNKAQKQRKFASAVFYEKNKTIFDDISEFSCMRVYHNDGLKKTVLVPYVFLKPLSTGEIDKVLSGLQDKVDSTTIEENNILTLTDLHDGSVTDAYVLKYEYLTCLLSDLYGIYMWKNYLGGQQKKWSDVFEDDSNILSFSYGLENVLSMEMMCKVFDSMENIALSEMQNTSFNDRIYNLLFKKEQESIELIKEMISFGDEIGDSEKELKFVRNYFAKCGEYDEMKAAKEVDEERIWGITTQSLRCEATNRLGSVQDGEFYTALLNCMDTGVSALTVKPLLGDDDKLQCVAAVLNEGEQAYRIKVDEYMQLLGWLKRIEVDYKNLYMKSRATERIDAFLELAESEFNDPFCMRNDIRKIQRIMQQQNRTYSDIYVYRPREEDPSKDKIYKEYYHRIMQ